MDPFKNLIEEVARELKSTLSNRMPITLAKEKTTRCGNILEALSRIQPKE